MTTPAIVTSKKADRSGTGRRIGRILREVAVVPTLVVAGFAILALISILADQTHALPPLDAVRKQVSHVMGAQAASAALQAVATGLVTVTSITFSVLLLAVQQTASSLSPVVFNQFLQRRSNQVYLGFFVGLALYSYVVMAAVKDKMPPIIGATVAVLLTLVALAILLVLVYSTIVQMRPTSVIRAIHDRTLLARQRESELVLRTRRASESHHQELARYVSLESGYVTAIDLRKLVREVADDEDIEVVLHVTIGSHLGHGDVVASVKDGDPERAKRIAHSVAEAVELGPEPELSSDATTGISEIGNIAWTSGSTAKHNPAVARQALNAITDIASRWFDDKQPWIWQEQGGQTRSDKTEEPAGPQKTDGGQADDSDVLPVVYEDNDLDRVLDILYNLLVSSQESHQHQLAAWVLDSYAVLLRRAPEAYAERMQHDLEVGKPLLDELPPSPMLAQARERLDDVRRHLDSDDSADGDGADQADPTTTREGSNLR